MMSESCSQVGVALSTLRAPVVVVLQRALADDGQWGAVAESVVAALQRADYAQFGAVAVVVAVPPRLVAAL